MKQYLLLAIGLILITMTGCGGGGTSATGSIQGIVSITPTELGAHPASGLTKAQFSKASLRTAPIKSSSNPKERIVKLRPGLTPAQAEKIIAGLGGKLKKRVYGTEATYIVTFTDSVNFQSSIPSDQNVEFAEDNFPVYSFAVPNDPLFVSPYHWNYLMASLPSAWDINRGRPEIIVAVLDTGVSNTHPDLVGKLVPGYDFVDNDSDPSDNVYFNSDNALSHGTHVAGIIGAATDNQLGIAGVGWNVKIMPIRILGPDGFGNTSDLAAGIYWAVNHGAKVINLSLGGSSISSTVIESIDYAIASGVTVIAAAGNENSSVSFPASYPPVIAVAALDEQGLKASYSNYGTEIDIAAPGGGVPNTKEQWPAKAILSLSFNKDTSNYGDCYAYMVGTSQAAPHVSGVTALLYSYGLTTPSEIVNRLKTTATAMNNSSYYGAGKLNAYAALGGTHNFSKLKVFYYKLPDETTKSPFYAVADNGSYTLTKLSPGTYKVCAFLDQDLDGNVTAGEPVGETEVVVNAGVVSTANITLN